MSFDITSVLKSVSESDTGKEQIVYLPIDVLDPDENNFYSLDGIDELADSIATVGLQQPVRVRRGSEPGRYTIVSGHRRRAAILLLRDSEDEREKHLFDGGVPSIIERDAVSPALQELRLIYANSATRSMTAADLSKQAERVEALLYKLQDEGMEFTGRMRDHVAAACKASKTKLARLHAIRKNLDPGWLSRFDAGELPEETAYQLQRLPADIQAAAWKEISSGRRKRLPPSSVVEEVNRRLEDYQKDLPCRAHAGGPDCHHKQEKILRSLFVPYNWEVCGSCGSSVCCMRCNRRGSCSAKCREAKARQKLEDDERKEQEAKENAQLAKKQECFRRQRTQEAKRLLPLIEAAGQGDDLKLPGKFEWMGESNPTESLKRAAAGDFDNGTFLGGSCLPDRTEYIKVWAKRLNCSVDFLLNRTDDPRTADQIKAALQATPLTVKDLPEADIEALIEKLRNDRPQLFAAAAAPAWQTGTPTEPGEYAVRIGMGQNENPKASFTAVKCWTGNFWSEDVDHGPIKDWKVYRWAQLPEV